MLSRDELLLMAREVSAKFGAELGISPTDLEQEIDDCADALEHFGRAVEARALEEAAKVCAGRCLKHDNEYSFEAKFEASECASAIRALKNNAVPTDEARVKP